MYSYIKKFVKKKENTFQEVHFKGSRQWLIFISYFKGSIMRKVTGITEKSSDREKAARTIRLYEKKKKELEALIEKLRKKKSNERGT